MTSKLEELEAARKAADAKAAEDAADAELKRLQGGK